MQAAALTAGQRTDHLLLVLALEVEAADVGARLNFDAVDVEDVQPAGHFLEHRVVAFQRATALIHVGKIDRRADVDRAAVGFFLSGDHLEQGGLTCAVGTDDADDGTRWHDEREIVDQ